MNTISKQEEVVVAEARAILGAAGAMVEAGELSAWAAARAVGAMGAGAMGAGERVRERAVAAAAEAVAAEAAVLRREWRERREQEQESGRVARVERERVAEAARLVEEERKGAEERRRKRAAEAEVVHALRVVRQRFAEAVAEAAEEAAAALGRLRAVEGSLRAAAVAVGGEGVEERHVVTFDAEMGLLAPPAGEEGHWGGLEEAQAAVEVMGERARAVAVAGRHRHHGLARLPSELEASPSSEEESSSSSEEEEELSSLDESLLEAEAEALEDSLDEEDAGVEE
jgi:hypothetical protein